ncbi:MAG: SPOR domain-containing protein, partial [Desulfobulbaceae bacterium]|nr:SPOR domain-containing protein [Desulfobulbaceae bacterium]
MKDNTSTLKVNNKLLSLDKNGNSYTLNLFYIMNPTEKQSTKSILIIFTILLVGLLAGCGRKVIESPRPAVHAHPEKLARKGYSIQVGTFKNLNNAARLYKKLQSYDL